MSTDQATTILMRRGWPCEPGVPSLTNTGYYILPYIDIT